MSRALIFGLILTLAPAVFAQNGPRGFDNFDRSQGVQVYLPPARPAILTAKKAKKKGTKWAVTVTDPLVKKTAMTASVADGLAAREGAVNPTVTSFKMGSSAGLKGFTTGSDAVDAMVLDSSRRYGIDPLLIYSQMHQ